ncbi:hypothetical protein ACHAXN_003090 [Cyclotella atomus]
MAEQDKASELAKKIRYLTQARASLSLNPAPAPKTTTTAGTAIPKNNQSSTTYNNVITGAFAAHVKTVEKGIDALELPHVPRKRSAQYEELHQNPVVKKRAYTKKVRAEPATMQRDKTNATSPPAQPINNTVATAPTTSNNKSIEQKLHQLNQHITQKHCTTSQSEHRFKGREMLVNLLQTAHEELHQSTIKQDHDQFQSKLRELQTILTEKRKRVMEKMDAACDTEGKVDSDLTTGLLQRVVLCLKRGTPVLEESVRRLMELQCNDDGEEYNKEISLVDREDREELDQPYKLAGRVLQEDGEELEIYEHC